MKKNIKIGLLAFVAVYLLSCENPVKPVQDNVYDPGGENFVVVADLATNAVTDIGALEAVSGGRFENDYGTPVTAKGVCWGTDVNPLVGGSCTTDGEGFGEFTSRLTNLIPETSYYVRAYATNTDSTIYGGQLEFTTLDGKPVFSTPVVSGIGTRGASISGSVSGDGGSAILLRGFVWSVNADPTTQDSVRVLGEGLGEMSVELGSMTPGSTYHFRAFVESGTGVHYSAGSSFKTLDGSPVFGQAGVTAVTATSATATATITSDGGEPITRRGVCYATTENPTTEDTCMASGTGRGDYSVTLTGLEKATAYFIRPYATNSVMTGYGAQVSFVTSAVLPVVTTGSANSITATSATVSGNVTSDGGSTQTSRGICYATTQNPTIANTCVASGTGAGAFEAALSGLSMGTIYYARAYATNPIGTTYGSQISFTTLTGPTVTTGVVSNITSTGATVAGSVTLDGGSPVTARGICYSTTQNPSTSGTCLASGSGTGSFTATLSGLALGTIYYVRAYATNGVATTYGTQVSFTTLAPPTVTTDAVSNITLTGATASGNVTADGGAPVTTRGVCYATTQNPTTSDTCVASGSGTASFTAALSGLTVATTYYVRAYATNSVGTSYGNNLQFTTRDGIIELTTGSARSILSKSATIEGIVTADGGAPVTTRGVCYATTQNPTTANTCVASGIGVGAFTATLTGLNIVTTYYVRAYATNSVGTAYGTQVEFTTNASPLPVTDIDGNVYLTIEIGTQVWMAANLRTTRYRTGATINNVTSSSSWSIRSSGAWVNLGNNVANDAIYGKLYNWYAATDTNQLCPTGWHVPSKTEWTILSTYLGTDAGFKMKSTTGWSSNGGGSNASGFTGLPGGFRSHVPVVGFLAGDGVFWSSPHNDGRAWGWRLLGDSRDLFSDYYDKRHGFSVRCVQD